MKSKSNSFKLLAVGVVVFAAISLGLFLYDDYISEHLGVQVCNTLNEIMEQQMYNFDLKLNGDRETMQAFADIFSGLSHDHETLIAMMNRILTDTDFEYINFVTPDGKTFNQEGTEADISETLYFAQVMAGKSVISNPVKSKIRDAMIIVIAASIEKDGKIVGALLGSYKTENLNKLFLPSFNGAGYAYVTTNSGEIIAKATNTYSLIGDNTNLFEVWGNADFYMHDDLRTIRKNLYANKGGHSRYIFNGQARYLHYATINVNNWNIFAIVPEQAITTNTNRILNATLLLSLAISLLFLLLIIYMYFSDRRYVKTLTKMAFIDGLTGASNLNKFKIDVQNTMQNNPEREYVLIKLDVENFKLLNDMHGFEVGDNALKSIVKALRAAAEHEDETFARAGSDEFVVLLRFSSWENLDAQRKTFIKNFYKFMGMGFIYKIKFPTGQYLIKSPEEEKTNSMSMLEKVNFAHRKAKEGTGNKIIDYDDDIKESIFKEKDIENKMEGALRKREFKVYLQPKYRLSDEKIGGVEALVRWKPAGSDLLNPGVFVPLFERNGFITKLDMYMFNEVCATLRQWIDEGITPPVVSVNFSRLHLNNKNFVPDLCKIADEHKVPHDLLEIELTESAMLENEGALLAIFEQLHREKFLLSMDDFGTGYSSLGLLKNLPVDVIKIDRSFFLAAHDNERAKSVLSNVIHLAKDLRIHIVAEGVEEKVHIDMLKEMGCDMVQGYYYAKPMPVAEFGKLI